MAPISLGMSELGIAILGIITVLATTSFGIPHETYFTPSKVTQYYRHYTESRRTRNQTKTGLLDERMIMAYRLGRRSLTLATKSGNNGLRLGKATRASEWMLLCLAYLIITFEVILLTITMTIRCVLIAVLELAVLMTPLQQ